MLGLDTLFSAVWTVTISPILSLILYLIVLPPVIFQALNFSQHLPSVFGHLEEKWNPSSDYKFQYYVNKILIRLLYVFLCYTFSYLYAIIFIVNWVKNIFMFNGNVLEAYFQTVGFPSPKNALTTILETKGRVQKRMQDNPYLSRL